MEEVPLPKPGPQDAVVKVETCGICGTATTAYLEGNGGGGGVYSPPTQGGHEIGGRVAEFGTGVRALKEGRRVAVNPMLARSAGYMEAVKVGGFGTSVKIDHAAFGTNFPGTQTDIYIDTAGARQVIETALAAAKFNARILFFGTHQEPVAIQPLIIISKELTLRGACGYRPDAWGPTIALVAVLAKAGDTPGHVHVHPIV
jgi:threonine dehydrogenase-like Zn-dependent dehydrogenase